MNANESQGDIGIRTKSAYLLHTREYFQYYLFLVHADILQNITLQVWDTKKSRHSLNYTYRKGAKFDAILRKLNSIGTSEFKQNDHHSLLIAALRRFQTEFIYSIFHDLFT